MILQSVLENLHKTLQGEVLFDNLHKTIYATDASVYRKIPLAVAFPKNENDLKILIDFASKNSITLIPRTAGTSLAGQCVGEGIVVDVSKYFTKIIYFDETSKTITVQPGIVRDELNNYLKPFGLFFGPNTSTSNRCMIGGMVGNNSSGSTSIKYGVTRDKVLKIEAILSDGTSATFQEITSDEFIKKTKENSLEGNIYKTIFEELSSEINQKEIKKEFPKETIHRRNTGYAVDEFLKCDLFGGTTPSINIAKLLTGSEGTLAFSTEITLQLDALPPKESIMVCSHFTSINESMKATLIAMKHNLYNCELMDKTILDCTKNNREQTKNRFFLQGDPEAILMLEVSSNSIEETEILADKLIADLEKNNFGFYHPKVYGADINKVHELRKAGLGLLGNIVGDMKAVACIEDTAVALEDLPNYIEEFTQMMNRFQQNAVYYAHAGAGEIHLRPILNLKKPEDVVLFRKITTETAQLVKKYQGSFSGEHGDGIVRAEFIPLMIGEKNYQLLRRIKKAFDPQNVFNQGKITDAFPMDKSLRYEVDRKEPEINTIQDFSDSEGILKLAEKCNGSGDCRKPASAGGSMCPSYRATKNEKDTTRARANALRDFLTNSDETNKFNHKELKEVFDLCLSCKACASECPSNVDIATMKAEFLYQYQETNGYSFRNSLFANNVKYNKIGSIAPAITNLVLNTSLTKSVMGIAQQRSIPKLANTTFSNWFAKQKIVKKQKIVYLFNDEFTNFYDVEIGKDAIFVLEKLGYEIKIVHHAESGRSFISKGFLKEAKKVCDQNIEIFKDVITDKTPLIGIEPSAILTFRDEYIRLATDKKSAENIAKNAFTFEEFLSNEYQKNNIDVSLFTSEEKEIKIHGHCHQKALSSTHASFQILNIPTNYKVTILNTGCCGMAGSFGYEKEHYEISMQVGEDTLFPKIRNCAPETEIAASGTSCRHQIYDGTKRIAKHPITLLKEALI
ncbi:MAG: FAD-binding protein [Flavobacteriia bacterium]|nr:FAD-binding protein [Flavobacteriia bacterium]OIP47105.1 MAG: FAD-binding oxidoreductase [Flavobacteriaceae bacterium CG2_30_31_66]PIV96432.1 MAG: FAD-binding oxidoreductase [Flavobacteriaceae bacterium CG17_big_fil_post_rev_8_21_14_2_50_31_13]PIY14268.1 MAG: FAD-binding oxidoreductase [Flavobacteriaceae bacterium CG_4_10_14_3_um_filter_31_253]PIZ11428.1 MAG: FAD-binding oxidoreductase [Flavobacteriaceae bacterium CG_4_10_14_0_8_um_filter_31_99]PJC08786.1 MAG: FAD-binding oxidoreductase [Fl